MFDIHLIHVINSIINIVCRLRCQTITVYLSQCNYLQPLECKIIKHALLALRRNPRLPGRDGHVSVTQCQDKQLVFVQLSKFLENNGFLQNIVHMTKRQVCHIVSVCPGWRGRLRPWIDAVRHNHVRHNHGVGAEIYYGWSCLFPPEMLGNFVVSEKLCFISFHNVAEIYFSYQRKETRDPSGDKQGRTCRPLF